MSHMKSKFVCKLSDYDARQTRGRARVIHIASSATETYCRFELTTQQQLLGVAEVPTGLRLCENCLSLQRRAKIADGKFRGMSQHTMRLIEAGPGPACGPPPWLP